MKLRVSIRGEGGARCPYCHDGLVGDETQICSRCKVEIHRECAEELSLCPTMGCGKVLGGRRAPPRRRRDNQPTPDGNHSSKIALAVLVLFLLSCAWTSAKKKKKNKRKRDRWSQRHRQGGPAVTRIDLSTSRHRLTFGVRASGQGLLATDRVMGQTEWVFSPGVIVNCGTDRHEFVAFNPSTVSPGRRNQRIHVLGISLSAWDPFPSTTRAEAGPPQTSRHRIASKFARLLAEHDRAHVMSSYRVDQLAIWILLHGESRARQQSLGHSFTAREVRDAHKLLKELGLKPTEATQTIDPQSRTSTYLVPFLPVSQRVGTLPRLHAFAPLIRYARDPETRRVLTEYLRERLWPEQGESLIQALRLAGGVAGNRTELMRRFKSAKTLWEAWAATEALYRLEPSAMAAAVIAWGEHPLAAGLRREIVRNLNLSPNATSASLRAAVSGRSRYAPISARRVRSLLRTRCENWRWSLEQKLEHDSLRRAMANLIYHSDLVRLEAWIAQAQHGKLSTVRAGLGMELALLASKAKAGKLHIARFSAFLERLKRWPGLAEPALEAARDFAPEFFGQIARTVIGDPPRPVASAFLKAVREEPALLESEGASQAVLQLLVHRTYWQAAVDLIDRLPVKPLRSTLAESKAAFLLTKREVWDKLVKARGSIPPSLYNLGKVSTPAEQLPLLLAYQEHFAVEAARIALTLLREQRDPGVRAAALTLLATHRDQCASSRLGVSRALVGGLRGNAHEERMAVLRATLSTSTWRQLRSQIQSMALTDRSPEIRMAALFQVRKHEVSQVRWIVRNWAKDSRADFRVLAAKALTKWPYTDRSLRRALQRDPDPTVRKAAAGKR